MSRVALVTGGTRGIGAAISIALKNSGCKVAATYGSNSEAAEKFSSENGELVPLLGDLRTSVLSQGWHWIDIDPFGSPVPFLDTAIQALARRGVLEVSATDTAAL